MADCTRAMSASAVDGTHLKIVDRMKDVIITAVRKEHLAFRDRESAEDVAVRRRGNRYRSSSEVSLRHSLRSSSRSLQSGPKRMQITHSTYQVLTEKDEVRTLIARVVEEANGQLAGVEPIKQFACFPKQLDDDAGELTATQKVKRAAIEDQFGELIDGMYR